MAVTPDHGRLDQTLQGIHVPYQFSYANAGARTAATGFLSTDVGKFARQLDDNSIWMLIATTPTWFAIGTGSIATVTTGGSLYPGSLMPEPEEPEIPIMASGGGGTGTGPAGPTGAAGADGKSLYPGSLLLEPEDPEIPIMASGSGGAGATGATGATGAQGASMFSLGFEAEDAEPILEQRFRGGPVDFPVALALSSLGVTSADGFILQNLAPAAAGAQQMSPRLHFQGQGWRTNATAESERVDFIIEVLPVQGAANPTANFNISSSVNGAAYTNVFQMTSTGRLTLIENLTLSPGKSVDNNACIMGSAAFQLATANSIGWSTTSTASAATDLSLFKDSARVLAQRDGTNANTKRVYNTFTSSTNFERFSIDWITSANVCLIGTEKGSGGGTARILKFMTDATARWSIGATTGHFFAETDNSFDIGATGANRPKDAYLAGSLTIGSAAQIVKSSVALTDGAGAGAGTITNAPAAGNPTKWIGINDNGTIRYVPAW